ncbi:MAG: response regulator [gamma proteobacterium endosymbiont of Lamellibrachia anaximandri]|nr:response regulator [gamma proteobacterium endosymbiont of Lamellibrachia anaximandri]MBL3535561.1 response regulator [gamma proteobacterium endosymbiont of Lamellibrachia anaximandri]
MEEQITTHPLILGVDDEPLNQIILEELLSNEFELMSVENGLACIESVATRKPDLIIMDVNMPVLNGLETCRRLRQDPDYAELPIVIVSALASPEERLEGYDAGADDYITKPFDEDELKAKICIALKNSEQKKSLRTSSQDAMQMAMAAMTSAAEYGVILRFFQNSFSSKDFTELGQQVFSVLDEYGLSGSLIMKPQQETIFITKDGLDRPLEQSVLESLVGGQRIVEFGNRAVFNGEKASLLIRSMPHDDGEKVGRLKDTLAVLIEGVDARIKGIETEQKLYRRQQELSEVIEMAKQSLAGIGSKHKQQRIENAQILSDMGVNIERSFMHLGLSEEQEKALMAMVTETEAKTDALYEAGQKLDEQFGNIMLRLNSSLEENSETGR